MHKILFSLALLVGGLGVCHAQVGAADLRFKTPQGYVNVLASAVASIDLRFRNSMPCTLTGTPAQFAVRAIAFAQPSERGAPGGLRSAKITIHFSSASAIAERSFSVQNDRIAEDDLYPEVTYDVAQILDTAWYRSLGCP